MLDPQTCQSCHPNHYNEWLVSMHAAASDDPVFRAMNARGQRETKGQLADFCIKCHAPMALAEGATKDGTNLDSVPKQLHGVTCFFCHTIDAVTGTHDAAVTLSGDLVMRGEISDPVASTAHASAHDDLQDRTRLSGATMCGACHDIVAPPGGHIERTFQEWQGSIFSQQPQGDTCAQCHMYQSASKGPVAQVTGQTLPPRYTYAHDFPGVDVALPGYAAAGADEDAVRSLLQTTLQGALCVTQQTAGIRVIVDNVDAGHFWPSGASQDRRAWAEVIATKGAQTIYQSGVVPDGTAVTSITSTTDPDLWLMRDCIYDASGNQVDMFWQAATYDGNALPAPVTFDMTQMAFYKTHIVQNFPRALGSGLPQMPDQVTLRIRIQPIGLDVLQDLVKSGDLKDMSVLQNMPTWDVLKITWTPQLAQAQNLTYVDMDGEPVSCVSPNGFNVGADKYPAPTHHMKCSP
jgi:hypothetical protein